MLDNISKRYVTRGKGSTLALREVSLAVMEGEFVAIVGPSGCGKSTLLRLIAGLTAPSTGMIEVFGKKVSAPLRNVGIVFQSPVLMKWRTIYQNVALPLEVLGISTRQQPDPVLDLLELAGIKEFAGNYPKELSGGMQQRVSICRALVHNPPLLLLDEPFGALDAMTRNQMNLDLAEIWARTRKTTILITHSVSEAVFLADKVIVLSARPGEIQEIVKIPIKRPRTVDIRPTVEFRDLVQKIGAYIGFEFA